MATVDIVLAAIVLVTLVLGFLRGVAKEIISLAILLVSFIAAFFLYPSVASLAGGFFAYPEAASFFAFMAAFTGPVFIGGLTIFIVSRLTGPRQLAFSHRALGGALGVLRGCAAGMVLIIALLAFPLRSHPLDRSSVFPAVLRMARVAKNIFPEKMAISIEHESERIGKAQSEEPPDGRKPK
ncbi:MAG: CvpA family protein [Acidobacteriota bacterium]